MHVLQDELDALKRHARLASATSMFRPALVKSCTATGVEASAEEEAEEGELEPGERAAGWESSPDKEAGKASAEAAGVAQQASQPVPSPQPTANRQPPDAAEVRLVAHQSPGSQSVSAAVQTMQPTPCRDSQDLAWPMCPQCSLPV